MYRLYVAEARATAQEAEAARELAQDESTREEICREAFGRSPHDMALRARKRTQRWVHAQRASTGSLRPRTAVDAVPTEGGFRVVQKSRHRGPSFLSTHHASTSRAYYRGGGEIDEERSRSLREEHSRITSHSIDVPPKPLDEPPGRHPVHHCFRDRDPDGDLGGLWKATPVVPHEPAVSQLSPRKIPSHFFKSEWRPEGPPFAAALDFDLYARPKTSHGDESRDRRRLCQIVAEEKQQLAEQVRLETEEDADGRRGMHKVSSTGLSQRSLAQGSRKSSDCCGSKSNNHADDRGERLTQEPRSAAPLRERATTAQSVFSSAFPSRRLSELEVRPRTAVHSSVGLRRRNRLYSVTIRSLDVPQA